MSCDVNPVSCDVNPVLSPSTDKEMLVTDAGKLTILDQLLGRLKTEGHRVLIYSQMTRMIDILEVSLLLSSFPPTPCPPFLARSISIKSCLVFIKYHVDNNNNNDFLCASILEDQTQVRDKTNGLSNTLYCNRIIMRKSLTDG